MKSDRNGTRFESGSVGIVRAVAIGFSLEKKESPKKRSKTVSVELGFGAENDEVYEYRTVQFAPGVGVRTGEAAGAAAKHLQTVLDREARGGWEFWSLETFTVWEQPGCGCLGSLLGMRPTATEVFVAVFRRDAS